MKALYSIIFLSVCFVHHSFAQYSVVFSTENYVSLVGADTVDETAVVQFNAIDVYHPVPIGFSFELNGEVFDSLSPAHRGFALFKDLNPKYSLSFLDCELKDFNNDPLNSQILYLTEGAVGDRIFKCEYKSMGFLNDPQNDDFASVQLWLYENCNDFEIRIGNYMINSDVFLNSYPAQYIGFNDYNNSANVQVLSGSPLNPTLVSTNSSLDTIPPINSVYTFSKCSANVDELNETFSFYPNPVQNELTVVSEKLNGELEIDIFDITGTKVYSSVIIGTAKYQKIDLEQLSRGSYIMVLTSQGKTSNHKIIKN